MSPIKNDPNPFDWQLGNVVVYTNESVRPVCDKLYHMNNNVSKCGRKLKKCGTKHWVGMSFDVSEGAVYLLTHR